MITFNKEINIGHVVTAIVLLFGLVGFAYAMKADIAELTLKQEFSTEVTANLNRESLRIIREIQSDSETFDAEAEDRLDELEKKMAVMEAAGR